MLPQHVRFDGFYLALMSGNLIKAKVTIKTKQRNFVLEAFSIEVVSSSKQKQAK